MSSINLLPGDVNLGQGKENKTRIAGPASAFMVIASLLLFLVLFGVNKFMLEKDVESLGLELKKKDNQIEKEIKNNKLLSLENRVVDARFLLANHPYFGNVINIIQDNLVEEVYLFGVDISYNIAKIRMVG